MSLLIFNVTCFSDNRLVIHSTMRDRDNYDCDPAMWMAPGTELIMTSKVADVSIEIDDVYTSFSLHARFKVFRENGSNRLEIREVTKYLGACFYINE